MAEGPGGLPVHDNHFHCRPDGWKGLDAVRLFQKAGGTSIAHVRLPAYVGDVEAFTRTCREHVAFGRRIREETGLTVHTAIGPYPLEPLKVAEARGWDAAEAFGRACFDACIPFFESGEAVCLGEVGRPHFPVDAEAWTRSNALLEYGMQVARDAGVPIMLHTEHAEPATMAEFAAMADRAGLARDRVIKHYCGPLVRQQEHHGIVPSVICSRSNVRHALEHDPQGRFLLETDYIDEPTRPNVVMPPDTVPKRTLGLVQNGEFPEDAVWSVHKEWPERLYGAE